MKIVKTACSLDCWDCCAIDIVIDENNQIQILGDKDHPITRGFLCHKGLKHLERLNSPDRILQPMKKMNNQWIPIQWDQAITEIGDQLLNVKEKYGSYAVMHYNDWAHGGLLKNIDSAFLNSYGGVTTSIGSLCWGAGIAAQTLDFGKVLSHSPEDHLNAKTILIWGRNPVYTNIHLVPFLKEAKANGSNIVVIDPVKTATASMATHYFQIKPGSDGFLALAMSKIIMENLHHDTYFTGKYCTHFDQFHAYVHSLNLDTLIERTNLSKDDIYTLVELYANHKPSAIILGYGLQRYQNGGKNIRLIDALAALTGNIGIAGGGVSYANKYVTQWINWDYALNTLPYDPPTFKQPLFSKYILEDHKDDIKGIIITKSNPVVQLPDTKMTIEALNSIPFKVVIDLFMTDTAQLADYVLPCTHIFEEEDFLFTSMWHSYFYYTERAFSPRGKVKSEFEVFKLLAKYMQMSEYLEDYGCETAYLEKSLSPLLLDIGLSLEDIKGKRFKLSGNEIPWGDKVFATASRKFEFIVPEENLLLYDNNNKHLFPLQLLTLHPKHSLHSQHYMEEKAGVLPKIFVSQCTLSKWDIRNGQKVILSSPSGKIEGIIALDAGIGPDVVVIYEGWWLKNQGVNHLTPVGLSDMGNQAIYNDCFCRIEK